MGARLDYLRAAPGGIKALHGLEAYVGGCGLEPSLRKLVNLTLAIVAINGWNRLSISFRAVAGSYEVKGRHTSR